MRVIVSNIGTVHTGDGSWKAFNDYVHQSKTGYGKAAYETVTLMDSDRIVKEHHPKLKTPTIAKLARIIIAIKPAIEDDFKEEPDDEPNIQLTIGCGYNGWSYQSGDNSFTGGAYGYPYWGVGYITRRCNSRELAREIIQDALNQLY